jgi:hypothetical protein
MRQDVTRVNNRGAPSESPAPDSAGARSTTTVIDHMTVLSVRPGRRAAKVWIAGEGGWTSGGEYDCGGSFRHHRMRIDLSSGIQGAETLVRRIARSGGRAFAIHGGLIPGRDRDGWVARRKNARPGKPAFFRDRDARWHLFDCDAGSWPGGVVAWTPEAVREAAEAVWREHAPPGLRQADVLVHLSNSAGFYVDGPFKAHYIVALERAVCSRAWHGHLKRTDSLFDEATSVEVQPLYLSNPICRGGSDPLEQAGVDRVFLLRGEQLFGAPPEDVVDVAELDAMDRRMKEERQAARERRMKARQAKGCTTRNSLAGWIEGRLATACQRIANRPDHHGAHDEAGQEAYVIGGLLHYNEAPSRLDVEHDLISAATSTGLSDSRARDAVIRGLDDGERSELDLDTSKMNPDMWDGHGKSGRMR